MSLHDIRIFTDYHMLVFFQLLDGCMERITTKHLREMFGFTTYVEYLIPSTTAAIFSIMLSVEAYLGRNSLL